MRTFLKLSLLLPFFSLVSLETGCKPRVDTSLNEADAQNPEALFSNGVLLLQTPDRDGNIDYTTALDRFKTSASLFESTDKVKAAKAHFNAGWVAESTGNSAEAVTQYRAAYEANPDYDQALYSLSRMLTATGHASESVTLFQKEVEKAPADLTLRNDLVAAYGAAGKYDEAMSEAQEILKLDPENAAAYRNLSTMYYAQGNFGMSKLCSEKALDLNKGDAGTYNNLGVTLLTQNDEPGAIEKLKYARELDANNYEANMNLGLIALNSGDYKLALDCFQKATASDPKSVGAKLGLAVALRGTGSVDEAASLYDQIIKADPKNETAYFNAATLHWKYTKDFNRSLKYLQGFIDSRSEALPADHPVYAEMASVKQAKLDEEARQAELKRLELEKKEREERALAILKDLDADVQGLQSKLDANVACLDPSWVEEINAFIENAHATVESKDTDMAPDIKSMLTDYYGPTMDQNIAASCAGGGGAPAGEAPAGGEPTPETPENPTPTP